jgi:hypothetical protein
MAERLTMEDRLGISEIVINHREKLKILLAAAVSAMTSNPRRARSVSYWRGFAFSYSKFSF